MQLADAIVALRTIPLLSHSTTLGVRAVADAGTRLVLDSDGLFWVAPFARGDSGSTYGWRLSLGEGHGAVVRTGSGHAVTVAARSSDALFAVIALERLLIGPKARAKLTSGWAAALPALRDAVQATGGDPDRLDRILHIADALAPWRADVPPEAELERRAMLATLLDDPTFPIVGNEATSLAWQRSADSRRSPDDLGAATRLLAGNHGLDGPRTWAGLDADASGNANALFAAAQAAAPAGLPPAPWGALASTLSAAEAPDPEAFLEPILKHDPVVAWEALAAATFWWRRRAPRVPEELAEAAEGIADHVGRTDVLAARRA